MRNRQNWMLKGGWLALAALAGMTLVGVNTSLAQQPKDAAQKPQTEAKGAEGKKAEGPKPGEEKTFEETVKDMEVRSGLFTLYRKADENKILLEIRPDQLEKTFVFAGTLEQATGERGLYAAQQGDDFPFYFHHIGKTIQWVQKNTSFTAAEGTPQARATARSFPESILGAAKIVSKPKAEGGSVLVDAAELFVSDLPGFAPALNQVYQPTNYHFDKANSNIQEAKAFPENDLLTITLHYVTDNPRSRTITLPDARSIPFVVKYDLFAIKDTGYQPRTSDDRVGHFLTVHQDFTSDHPSSPYTRYINRWQLEKADPAAAMSPPKQPIVFWLENTIPVEYRDAMRDGVLLWNKAFERLGFQDALVVKQQPDNPDWEAGDIRYSSIRWFAGVDATFAIGPSRANPYTGQTYSADIGMSEGLFRATRRQGEEFVEPSVAETEAPVLASAWGRNRRFQCEYGNGLAQQAAFAVSLLEARGEMNAEVEQKLMHEFVVEVTAHEVGHTLGLRHNFRASTLLDLADLDNPAKTEAIGQTSSVMDYNPIVIAPKGQKQGHFLTTTLGPYDYWAIEYAYKPIAGDPKAQLAKIASRVADPQLPYSTDEDALGTISPQAMDPLANQFDQSTDPLAYFKQVFGIVHELWSNEETKLAKQGEGYQILRRALTRGLAQYRYGLMVCSKYIGGIYTHRDHVGDPNARLPYVTVPAAKQREALETLRTYAFGEKAFQLPPELLNKAAIEREEGLDFFSYFTQQRLDYPWHAAVLAAQHGVLDRLYHPITLSRISDNELRFAPGEKPFTMADMFNGLDSAIWSELDHGAPSISSIRRNLQRDQLKLLIRLVVRPEPPRMQGPPMPFAPPPPPAPPDDATTLARASLVRLQGKIKKALAGATITDATTRAHLEETQALISSALQAQVQRSVD